MMMMTMIVIIPNSKCYARIKRSTQGLSHCNLSNMSWLLVLEEEAEFKGTYFSYFSNGQYEIRHGRFPHIRTIQLLICKLEVHSISIRQSCMFSK